YVDQGLRIATRAAEEIFSVLFVFLFLFVCVVEFLFPWLMYGIAPGFVSTPERFSLAIELTRVTFPYIMFISLVSFSCGILNSLDRFAVGAAMPILLNLSMISVLLFFIHLFPTPAHGLAWALTFGGIAQFFWAAFALQGQGIAIRPGWPRLTPAVRQLLKRFIPGALGAGVMQVNLLVDVILASFLP